MTTAFFLRGDLMALNKQYWDYDNADAIDWAGYGIKVADKQIYANPNFTWGNLDYSFPTSFRKRSITRLRRAGSLLQACNSIPDTVIYNSMIYYSGSGAQGSFYKDNYYSSYYAGNEGYRPVIDIDTHDFAYKMTISLFSGGNWITVNAVDFINNYDNYAATAYGYINNHMAGSSGRNYALCNFYVTEESQFSVHANMYGYRTSGEGSIELGGHAVSGALFYYNSSIYQLCATTASNYSNVTTPCNLYFPFEIPELNGQSWNLEYDYDRVPAALMTGGIYTNHAVLVYSDQRVYMPLKHILKDIIVNCGLVLLDSNNDKWISMVDNNGLCQNKLVLMSSDEAKESSIYNTRTSDNNLNPTPEPGPTPGPYDDDPWSGVSFSGVGVGGAGAFAKCYYMTSTELANLRSWMNSNNVPEGFDPMAQIIGLSQVPVSLSGDDNTTVQFVNSSAVYDPGVTRVVDSGVNTQISMGTPKKYSLGSVDIVRRMQERGEPYLDYDCQIELYLPLIGMFSLDTQAVMGRSITAEAVLDPISGTLAAYAYVSKDGQNLPIAYGSTTIGVDLPISAQQYSVSRAAAKQANAQLYTSLLSSTLSFIAAATAGGKGSGTGAKTATGSTNGLAAAGIREAGSDYMKVSQVGNVFADFMQWGRTIRQLSYGNNTAIAGSFGGSTAQWAYPFTPYVKIIRPRYEKPANYNHSQGVPCVQTKTIGSCTGFIQCLGVDVSGISGATDLELQAIQAALSNGIYAGGSQS